MIQKYGEEEGETRYIKMYTDRKLPDFTISKPQRILQELLITLIRDNNHEWIYHEGIGGKEFHHWNPSTKKNYFYDFVITSPFKAVIEFNGDFYHANPKLYKEDDIVKIPKHYKTAKEIWDYDKEKLNLLTSKGYTCKVIWEMDFYSDPEKIVKECYEWLISLSKE
jgi:very-short-patch-repair endonuclease